MNNRIKESINFLINNYKRLKAKEKKRTITKEEKIALDKLESFLGKK